MLDAIHSHDDFICNYKSMLLMFYLMIIDLNMMYVAVTVGICDLFICLIMILDDRYLLMTEQD